MWNDYKKKKPEIGETCVIMIRSTSDPFMNASNHQIRVDVYNPDWDEYDEDLPPPPCRFEAEKILLNHEVIGWFKVPTPPDWLWNQTLPGGHPLPSPGQ